MNDIEERYDGFKQVIIECEKQMKEYEDNLKKERKEILDLTDLYFELRKHTPLVRLHEKCSVSNKIMLVIGNNSTSSSSGNFIVDYYPNTETKEYSYKTTISGKYLPTAHYHSSLKDAVKHICESYESKDEKLGIDFFSLKDYYQLLNDSLRKIKN